jgi:hypothetical protein
VYAGVAQAGPVAHPYSQLLPGTEESGGPAFPSLGRSYIGELGLSGPSVQLTNLHLIKS